MAPKAEPEALPLAELVEAWALQLDSAPPLPTARLAQALQAASWRAVGAVLAGDPAKAPAAAAAALEAAEAAAALMAPPAVDWLATAAPQTPEALARLCWAASARAADAALTGDPSKAAAAVAAAVQAAQAGDALVAPAAKDSDAPVTEGEVAILLIRAVRRGLASDDPRKVGEALALWRQERPLVDPDGVVGAGAAMDAALLAEVEAAADLARAAGLAMRGAGDCG